MRTGKGIVVLALAFVLAAAPMAFAHGVWLSVRCDKTCIVLGDGPKDNAYDPARVMRVRGYAADHKEIDVGVERLEDHVYLNLPDNVAVVAIDFPSARSKPSPSGEIAKVCDMAYNALSGG